MALFLGTYNVPTNKKLRVNTTDVTEVYSNGVLVWKYVVPLTPGGLPTAGAKGHWVDTGRTIWVTHNRDINGNVTSSTAGAVGYGEKKGALTHQKPDSGATPANWTETYAIMRWVPTP